MDEAPSPRPCGTCHGDLTPAAKGDGYTYCGHCDRPHLTLAIHCDRCRSSTRKTTT